MPSPRWPLLLATAPVARPGVDRGALIADISHLVESASAYIEWGKRHRVQPEDDKSA